VRITIRLHGSLKAIHPEPIVINAATAAEAVEAISRQLPGFRPDPINGYKRVAVVGHETFEDLFKPLAVTELDIVPQFAGGKSGGFIQILIGVALIIVGIFTGNVNLILSGALMVLGGIMSYLQPSPKADGPKKNHYLGSNENTVDIGTPIAIIYGRDKWAGHILSFDVDAMAIVS
jgi:predicted phage tail protein